MKIEDLIKKLEWVKKKFGNIEVLVHYRDGGGYYDDYDEPDFDITLIDDDEDNNKFLAL